MNFVQTPFALGRTIVLAGIIPAIGVGTIWGTVLKPVHRYPASVPVATAGVGEPHTYSTPYRVTPTTKKVNKTPHGRGVTLNDPIRIAVTPSSPGAEPTPSPSEVSKTTPPPTACPGVCPGNSATPDTVGSPKGEVQPTS